MGRILRWEDLRTIRTWEDLRHLEDEEDWDWYYSERKRKAEKDAQR